MAVVPISSQSFTTSADSGSFALTVPSDCNFLLVALGGWDTDDLHPPTTLTVAGVAVTSVQHETADNRTKGYVGRLASPATGSQTLAFNFVGSGAPAEGVQCEVAYFKGVDTAAPVMGSAKTFTFNASAGVAVTVAATPGAGDLLVGWAAVFDANPTVTHNGQTALAAPAIFRSTALRGSYKLAANEWHASGGDEDWNTNIALVLRAAAEEGTTATGALVAPGGYTGAASAALRFVSTAALAAAGGYSGASAAALRFVSAAALTAPGGYAGAGAASLRFVASGALTAGSGYSGASAAALRFVSTAALAAAGGYAGASSAALRFVASGALTAGGGYSGASAAALRFVSTAALAAAGGYAGASAAALRFVGSAALAAPGRYVLAAIAAIEVIIGARRVVNARAARQRMRAALGVRRSAVTHYGLRPPRAPEAHARRRLGVPQHGQRKEPAADGVQ